MTEQLSPPSKKKIGLVLSGGGARGAYQAGVLKAIGEMCRIQNQPWPFQIMTGLSAGAINCTYLASHSEDFYTASKDLSEIWAELRSDDIFRTDAASLSTIGARWISTVMTGGWAGSEKPQSLVDTSPLHQIITRYLKPDVVDQHITNKKFESLCISATEYSSSRCVSFVQTQNLSTLWNKSRGFAIHEKINPDHVLASSAIPLLFPAVRIGSRFYGDGCLRNITPLSPSIKLGSDKLLVIGVRHSSNGMEGPHGMSEGATAGRILSVLLNAVLMDGLESDLEFLKTINHLTPGNSSTTCDFRKIPVLVLRPSSDIAQIAIAYTNTISPFIRYLTRGLGPLRETAEMISYLLFERNFCRALLELGHSDALERATEIVDFFYN